jgi:hypothetical protein
MKWEYSILTGEDALPQAALDQLGWEGWELVGLTAYVTDRAQDGIERTQVPVFVCVFKRPIATE